MLGQHTYVRTKRRVIFVDPAGLSLADKTQNMTMASGEVVGVSQVHTLAQIRQAVTTRAEEAYSTHTRWETEGLKDAPWHPLGLWGKARATGPRPGTKL